MNWPTSARRLASASVLSTALLFTATSCEEASDLGVELPGTNATSTEYRDFPVTASTVLQDSINTLKANSYLIGRVRDNALGTTTAKGYFNLKISPSASDTLPANVLGTNPNAQLDSVVLVMPFAPAAIYGSAASPLRVDVYPLTAPLDEQGVYNSASTAAADMAGALGTGVAARLNGTRTVRQRNDPSSSTDTSTFKLSEPNRTVRLKLNASNSLLTNVFGLLKNTSFSQSQLDAAWKGLMIQPTSNFNSAVVGFASIGSVSSAVFYYHYNKKVGTGTLKGTYSIPFGTQAAYATKANAPRYFTSIVTEPAAPFNQLQGASNSARSVPSSASGDIAYMQAGSGFVAKLEIPGLAELKQLAQPQATGGSPSIAINRAELQVQVQPSSNLLFALPANGYLYEVNANNEPLRRVFLNSRVERVILRDGLNQLGIGLTSIENNAQNLGYYQNAAAATPLAVSDVNRYYGLLMTSYVQAYVYDKLSGTTPAAFLFSPILRNSNALGLERAALDGKNIRLRVYYSKLR
ncbi:DUF4270 family protein [Hymenobacter sp. BT186]|uniref:DUF4270 family protein n=1 Tax=Hymenobacter telluris TaxID=2816474 RepID=A0A939EZ49_9BACT|nr:DUF4270 family protein [Hymenobacter telluris]MBO0359766.1 DUF4270 family protein [Hymenobacter telluris]MBW3375793.1 DUF4270 domain-containing protein [Hymenobacter norwichensis]